MSVIIFEWFVVVVGGGSSQVRDPATRGGRKYEEDEPLRRVALNVDDGPHGVVLQRPPQLLPELHPDGAALVQIGLARGGRRPRRAAHLLRGLPVPGADDVFGVEGVHGEARRGVGLGGVVLLTSSRKRPELVNAS